MKELTEAEAHNFAASTTALGNTVELLNDFESVYETLASLVALPEGGRESDDAMTVVAIVHEQASCCADVGS
ncbi:MAG: hypothetical protein ABSC05_29530 [Candidatus Solibacter sp.]